MTKKIDKKILAAGMLATIAIGGEAVAYTQEPDPCRSRYAVAGTRMCSEDGFTAPESKTVENEQTVRNNPAAKSDPNNELLLIFARFISSLFTGI